MHERAFWTGKFLITNLLLLSLLLACGLDPEKSKGAPNGAMMGTSALSSDSCANNKSCAQICSDIETQCIQQHPSQKSFCTQAKNQCLATDTQTVLATIRPPVGSGDPDRIGTGGGGAPAP